MQELSIGKSIKMLITAPIQVVVKLCSALLRISTAIDAMAASAEDAAINFKKISEVENESEFVRQIAAAKAARSQLGLDDVEVQSVQSEKASAFNTTPKASTTPKK